MNGPDVRTAAAAFTSHFGRPPRFAGLAPGRVNLIGEHTDYSGGFVLPIAIDRACLCLAAPAPAGAGSRIFAADLNEEVALDLRAALSASPETTAIIDGSVARMGSWPSYVTGVIQQFKSHGPSKAVVNLDIFLTSSVPYGSGLSSSAALEVAVATMMEQAVGVTLEPRYKAALCRRAEHEFAGVPCGIMDQFISVMGRRDHALLIDCRSQQADLVPMPSSDRALVVVMNTGVHHELASGEYAKRRDWCIDAAAKLGVPELREAASLESLAVSRGLTEEERRAMTHVTGENRRTLGAVSALRAGDLVGFGKLMYESHASLRDVYQVSCDELDTLVEAAASVEGVFGARLTGGGFGGCAIALARPDCLHQLCELASSRYRERHGRACEIFVTSAGEGARAVPLPSH